MAKPRRGNRIITAPQFFGRLRWLDRRPLLDTMEPYRRDLLTRALDTRRPDGTPLYNFVVSGRAKKNWKTTDLVLAALYCLTIRGGDGYLLANDEEQAGDDLGLAKKLVAINPDLSAELEVYRKEIRCRDGRGSLKVLPARDVLGSHGKTAVFIGFDEIHGYRNYDLFEALAPDPTRADYLAWVTSYDTIWSAPGVPLSDFKARGKAGTDPRMLFSWYSGDYCTDPAFAELEPELRANPSISSWPEGRAYLDQQRQRLPPHKYRRLHLNLPGAPNGAFLDQAAVMSAIVTGRTALPYEDARKYYGFVDMSSGGADDAVLAIGHMEDGRAVLDLVAKQPGEAPGFNPLAAVQKFVTISRGYGITKVMADNFAGHLFKAAFEAYGGLIYEISYKGKTTFYEEFEVALNAGEVELFDDVKVQEQLLTLVLRGAKVDHQPGDHDDHANAVAGCVWLMRTAVRYQDDVKFATPVAVGSGPRLVPGSDAPVGELACPERVAAPAPPVEEKPALNSPVQAKPGWQTELQRQRVNADKSAEYRYMHPRGNEPWRSFVGVDGVILGSRKPHG